MNIQAEELLKKTGQPPALGRFSRRDLPPQVFVEVICDRVLSEADLSRAGAQLQPARWSAMWIVFRKTLWWIAVVLLILILLLSWAPVVRSEVETKKYC